jgi:hypothetical protein
VLIALQSIIKDCLEELNSINRNESDEISKYDRIYRRLKNYLPKSEIIGYLTDETFDVKSFYLAQYALSPVFVVNNLNSQYFIADIRNPSDIEKFTKAHHLTVIHRAGENIFLLKKSL